MYTYLSCSADLCKHTSGCSANKSRLYCPLTSAELLIVNVTQLQRRDWGSLSLTSWLTAAKASLIYPWIIHSSTRHSLFNCRVHGLPASGRSLYRRLVKPTSEVFCHQTFEWVSEGGIFFFVFSTNEKENKYGVQGLKAMRPLKRK